MRRSPRPDKPPDVVHDLGFSCGEGQSAMEQNEAAVQFTFFSFQRARRPTPDTFTTLNRTPGISPLALPLRPKPEIRTSSFSSTKFRQPSFYAVVNTDRLKWDRRLRLTGTKAVTFFPFLISWTRTHFRMAEFGCLASTPTFSRTIPLAWDDPPVGDVL